MKPSVAFTPSRLTKSRMIVAASRGPNMPSGTRMLPPSTTFGSGRVNVI
jgi:hypothetical protein